MDWGSERRLSDFVFDGSVFTIKRQIFAALAGAPAINTRIALAQSLKAQDFIRLKTRRQGIREWADSALSSAGLSDHSVVLISEVESFITVETMKCLIFAFFAVRIYTILAGIW